MAGSGAARGPRYLHPLRLGAVLGRPHLQAGGDALLQQGPRPSRPRCRHGEPAALRAGPVTPFRPRPVCRARVDREAGPCAGPVCRCLNGVSDLPSVERADCELWSRINRSVSTALLPNAPTAGVGFLF